MDGKRFWKKLLFPPVWLMVLLIVVSTAALIFVFVRGLSESPLAYAVYAVAFFTLVVLVAFFTVALPKRYRTIRTKIYANPIGNRWLTDAAFKTHVSLYAALVVNLLYAGLNVLSWVLYHSAWFLVLTVYYVILAVMRFLLVRYFRGNVLCANRLGELKRARLCSVILLTLNFVLAGAVMMILFENKGFEYHGILIYVIALYTFYSTVHAIMGLIRYRKYHSPVMTVSRIIALSAALVSMLSLETAMFSQFGGNMEPEHQWLMIALTGAGASVVVIAMSVGMIAYTVKELKEFKKDGRKERNI